ncbi:ATP-binding protein [Aeromonas simiae]|uniref:ATP-binding protein n=1 Tax=Aeromonas simiae TaxID=218936 RepID=UPI00266BE170|nr:ATP-binding protein [Aeromonas simiae]MDO2947350.1 ATP-binding protein [Aeromonas simiae]MDO2951106.1 ATP-binding protein [Aeromonas simiae]MDO2954694.1 ATP-binding protein [Aeromonas simiae]
MRKSLHLKLMLSSMVVIGFVTAVAVYALYQTHAEERARDYSSRMNQNLSRLLSSNRPPELVKDEKEMALINGNSMDPSLDTMICRSDGELRWSNLHLPEVIDLKETLCNDLVNYLKRQDRDYFFKYLEVKQGEYFIYSIRFTRKEEGRPVTYYVAMIDSAKQYNADLHAYLMQKIRQSSAAYLLLIGVMLLSTRWTLRSLYKLRREIDQIRAGKRESLSSGYERELTPLTESVNQLLENERQQTLRYQHALNDLAHSLKTRLALLQITAQDAGLGKEASSNLNEQVLTMDQIIQYQLRRAVAGRQGLRQRGVEPIPLIEKLLASLAKVYQHKRLQTRFLFDDDVLFNGDQGDLMELMGNLLDNACKFAISQVQVTLRRHGERISITIEDDGPGVEPKKLDRIFQRGVRADSSGGQGIGLAVVSEIVDSYGGSIAISESALGGACFTLELP